jgi:hypothetical protein
MASICSAELIRLRVCGCRHTQGYTCHAIQLSDSWQAFNGCLALLDRQKVNCNCGAGVT